MKCILLLELLGYQYDLRKCLKIQKQILQKILKTRNKL